MYLLPFLWHSVNSRYSQIKPGTPEGNISHFHNSCNFRRCWESRVPNRRNVGSSWTKEDQSNLLIFGNRGTLTSNYGKCHWNLTELLLKQWKKHLSVWLACLLRGFQLVAQLKTFIIKSQVSLNPRSLYSVLTRQWSGGGRPLRQSEPWRQPGVWAHAFTSST